MQNKNTHWSSSGNIFTGTLASCPRSRLFPLDKMFISDSDGSIIQVVTRTFWLGSVKVTGYGEYLGQRQEQFRPRTLFHHLSDLGTQMVSWTLISHENIYFVFDSSQNVAQLLLLFINSINSFAATCAMYTLPWTANTVAHAEIKYWNGWQNAFQNFSPQQTSPSDQRSASIWAFIFCNFVCTCLFCGWSH